MKAVTVIELAAIAAAILVPPHPLVRGLRRYQTRQGHQRPLVQRLRERRPTGVGFLPERRGGRLINHPAAR
jgi:hypothetical protein